MVAVVAGLILAVLGLLVCVVLGALYVQYLARAHWHVLEKGILAGEYVVADLAEGEGGRKEGHGLLRG
eukprot:CAMPEP_0173220896 /NCGR_PEP_ID=MMETSP1142-20121109/2420_1 /TAXON_ID=483371 /ORGANISM="non described non described, Strain CCMP2298" /LENGTH=67 /DNA_ID=CAMNT_0014148867 /DNA_START=59 /DNA_END=258 /DNA_ORIENTATION=+